MADVAISPTSPTTARSTSVRVSVPLDPATAKPVGADTARTPSSGVNSTTYTARKLVRRDSMERREALLNGKEGSRQRRRWENGECRDH